MEPFARRLWAYLDRLEGLRQRSASEDSIRDAFLDFDFIKQDPAHVRLAELSQECHWQGVGMTFSLEQPIGRVRQEVRDALHKELREIDRLAKEVLHLR
ncbi:MAG: hypothetical protein ACK4K2_05810 [Dehalococcoidia bacterium]